jgi:hypothetical protein
MHSTHWCQLGQLGRVLDTAGLPFKQSEMLVSVLCVVLGSNACSSPLAGWPWKGHWPHGTSVFIGESGPCWVSLPAWFWGSVSLQFWALSVQGNGHVLAFPPLSICAFRITDNWIFLLEDPFPGPQNFTIVIGWVNLSRTWAKAHVSSTWPWCRQVSFLSFSSQDGGQEFCSWSWGCTEVVPIQRLWAQLLVMPAVRWSVQGQWSCSLCLSFLISKMWVVVGVPSISLEWGWRSYWMNRTWDHDTC